MGKVVDIEVNNDRCQFITVDSHYPRFKNYLSTEYQEEYQVKMNKIGNFASQLFLLLLNKHPYSWNRIAQGIIALSKEYSSDVVNLACKRALAFDSISYKTIKSICHNRTYSLPVEINYGELQ